MRRALVIVNCDSRQGGEDLQSATKILGAGGFEVSLFEAPSIEAARRKIRTEAEALNCVVVCGGDGTLQGCAPALIETRLPLGILPLGTANDLARTLEIPLDVKSAAEVIVKGRVRRIDMGSANGIVFFNAAHLGLGSRLKGQLTKDFKKKWGRLSYPLALVAAVNQRRAFRALLKYEGRQERIRSIQIAVGNGRHYGGGIPVSEDAAIDDGVLDVYSVPPLPLWRLAALSVQLFRGAVGEAKAIRVLRVPEVIIHTGRRMRVIADGEWVTQTPVRFRVLPAALQVYASSQETNHADAG